MAYMKHPLQCNRRCSFVYQAALSGDRNFSSQANYPERTHGLIHNRSHRNTVSIFILYEHFQRIFLNFPNLPKYYYYFKNHPFFFPSKLFHLIFYFIDDDLVFLDGKEEGF